ncbi:MAG: AraC family ligand binding domain-containing protein [Rubrivivax sp.]|nr:AraC family ligand binding domain-containing protein [Rubrivivax sp.]
MIPDDPEFERFRADALARGFTEVLARTWAPGTVLDTHTHPFAVDAVMTAGELWLTIDGRTRHLRPGDRFTLDADVPHAERYGDAGATYWVARR